MWPVHREDELDDWPATGIRVSRGIGAPPGVDGVRVLYVTDMRLLTSHFDGLAQNLCYYVAYSAKVVWLSISVQSVDD